MLRWSSLPLPGTDPLDATNRRISLVVSNEDTEREIRGISANPVADLHEAADVGQAFDGATLATEPPASAAP